MASLLRLAPLAAVSLLLPGLRPAAAQETPVVRSMACGRYEAVPSGFRRPAGQPTRLTIQKGGRLLVTLSEWAITSIDCEQIAPHTAPDLLVRTHTGGAHCCETLHVYALEETPRRLLLYEANSAAGYQLRDLDRDGRKELVLGDGTFAFFDDLGDASPSHLPLVACLVNGRFEECTAKYPDFLKAERRRYLRRLEPAANDEQLKEAEGAALGVVAISVLLGNEAEGLREVRQASPGEALQAWLAKALPQVRDWAAARAKRIKDGNQ